MDKLIALLFLVFCCSNIFAQEEPTYHIVYLDNSRVTNDDGLNDMILSKVMEQFDALRANKNDKFLFFVSNGKNFVVTENIKSVDKMIEQAFLSNPQKEPNQLYDINKLKESLSKAFSEFEGKVKFSAYVSENTAYKITDTYSPLFSIFPSELLFLSGQKPFILGVYYPRLSGRVKEENIIKCLNFYNAGEFQKNITLNIKGL